MMNKHVYILATVLAAIGAALFLYKMLIVGLPLSAEEKTNLWEIEAALTVEARGRPIKLSFFVPSNSDHYTVVNQSFVSPGFGLSTRDDGVNRKAVLSARKAQGKKAVYYRFVVIEALRKKPKPIPGEPVVRRFKMTEAEKAATQAIINTADEQSADTETFVAQVLRRFSIDEPIRSVSFLLGPNPTMRKKVLTAAKIMGAAKIPARVVRGVTLVAERSHVQFTHWLEVHDGDRWFSFLPDATGAGLPDGYLAWWRGTDSFTDIKGGDLPDTRLTVTRVRNSTLRTVRWLGETARDPTLTWSLFSLPLQTQLTYRVLLVVPLGVFLLVLLRNVVGVRTFGTFMPVLIALAFRETQLLWGLILFTAVVAIGLLIRLYLEHLKLLLVPRLGAVVIVVIGVMALMSLVSGKLGFVGGLSVALFPMVILTMTIERMSVVWDERGPAESLKEGIGSLVVAVLCYLVMSQETVEYLFFVFPELLLVLLALTLLLGRYSGYRLTELRRFRVLTKESL